MKDENTTTLLHLKDNQVSRRCGMCVCLCVCVCGWGERFVGVFLVVGIDQHNRYWEYWKMKREKDKEPKRQRASSSSSVHHLDGKKDSNKTVPTHTYTLHDTYATKTRRHQPDQRRHGWKLLRWVIIECILKYTEFTKNKNKKRPIGTRARKMASSLIISTSSVISREFQKSPHLPVHTHKRQLLLLIP
jgi:hypothetical protein